MIENLPPHDASDHEKKLWKKADRRRRQIATPLTVKEYSVKPVVTGDGSLGSPKTSVLKTVATTTVIRQR